MSDEMTCTTELMRRLLYLRRKTPFYAVYSRIFHLYDVDKLYSGKKPTGERGKPTTIRSVWVCPLDDALLLYFIIW